MSTAISFPTNPTIGDQYTFGDVTYVYDTNGWYVPFVLNPDTVGRVELKPALKDEVSLGNVGGTVNIDCSLGVDYTLNMTSAITSLTFSNYSTEQFKTITLSITGNFTITQPATVKGDWSAFDGTLTNQIQIYLFDVTTPVFSSGLINW